MKKYIFTYVYKRFWKWYIWEYITKTILPIWDITNSLIKLEIEEKEKTSYISIIEVRNER